MSSSSGSKAIERAVRFLSAPAVVANPNTDEKIHYLLTKGLSEEEVRLVMQLVEGKTKEAAPRPTRKEKAGGADMVVLLGGSQNSGSAGVIGDNTDDSSGEVQSIEAALITMRTERLRGRIDDVVKKIGGAGGTQDDVIDGRSLQTENESIYDVDEDVNSLVVMAAGDATPPSIPLLGLREEDEDDDDDCSVYDCDDTDEDSIDDEAKKIGKDEDDDDGTLVTADSSEIGTADERNCEVAQGWAPHTPTATPARPGDDFNDVEEGRSSPPATATAVCPPSPAPSEDSIDEISRALSEIRSDDLMTSPIISSTLPTKMKRVEMTLAGLPLLYLGPIDVNRPARYSSLANCVSQTLREHNNCCIMTKFRPKECDAIVLFGPAPSVRDDDPNNCWTVSMSKRKSEKIPSGDAIVSSGQRSWAPISVDDLSAEVSSIADVRRCHSCVAKALQSENYDEAIEILTDLLDGLEATRKRRFNEFDADALVYATKRNIAAINLVCKQYPPASKVLGEISRSHPGNLSSQVLLGLAQVATENLEEASTTFLEILVALDKAENDFDPDFGDLQLAKGTILNNLACCFIKRGEFSRAKTIYERALECLLGCADAAKKSSALTLGNLAKCLVQTKEYDLALDTLGSSVDSLQSYSNGYGDAVEWHYLTGIMKARALVAASVKQYMLALDTYEEMLNQLDYKNKEQYDLILEVYGNMTQIATEIGKHTPESGARFIDMIDVRREDVKRMRSRHVQGVLNLPL